MARSSGRIEKLVRVDPRILASIAFLEPGSKLGEIRYGALSDLINMALERYLEERYSININSLPETIEDLLP